MIFDIEKSSHQEKFSTKHLLYYTTLIEIIIAKKIYLTSSNFSKNMEILISSNTTTKLLRSSLKRIKFSSCNLI
jgi:hypothetical protein